MDTEEESHKWHKGIFMGVRGGCVVHDPRKLRECTKASNYEVSEFMDYYRNDEHYFDVPFVFLYGLTSAIELGLATVFAERLFATLL